MVTLPSEVIIRVLTGLCPAGVRVHSHLKNLQLRSLISSTQTWYCIRSARLLQRIPSQDVTLRMIIAHQGKAQPVNGRDKSEVLLDRSGTNTIVPYVYVYVLYRMCTSRSLGSKTIDHCPASIAYKLPFPLGPRDCLWCVNTPEARGGSRAPGFGSRASGFGPRAPGRRGWAADPTGAKVCPKLWRTGGCSRSKVRYYSSSEVRTRGT